MAASIVAGAYWWRGDHALVVVRFGGADQRDLDEGKAYSFVPRNQGRGSTWQVDAQVRVAKRR